MSVFGRYFFLPFLLCLLTACAGVSVLPLNYDGTIREGEAPGLRYYMPKPYLLVTQISPEAKIQTADAGNPQVQKDHTGPSGLPPPPAPKGGDDPSGGGGSPQNPTTSASSSSDLSYQFGNTTYLLKLIYLPDMSKTMAVNITPSILGTSSMQPTLQDGWMLTSLQASSDNTKALDAFTTLASAVLGGGAKAASDGAAGSKKPTPASAPLNPVLPPGLYEFAYDSEGHLVGLCAVSKFIATGPINNRHRCTELADISRNIVRVRG